MAAIALCDSCYLPTCARTVNAAAACNCGDFSPLIGNARQPNGTYSQAFRSQLPSAVADLSDSLLDGALRVAPTGLRVLPMSAGAIALYNNGADIAGPPLVPWYGNIAGADPAELYNCTEIYENIGVTRGPLYAHLKLLHFTGANAAAREGASKALAHFRNFDESMEKRQEKPKSANELEDARFPMARIYLVITKGVMASPLSLASLGENLDALSNGQFDKGRGTVIQEFEKLKMITDVNELHSVLREFLKTILLIGNNGGRAAWEPLLQRMYELLQIKPAAYVHVLFFKILKEMDGARATCNLGTFLSSHYQTFLMVFDESWGLWENDKPRPHDRRVRGEEDEELRPSGGKLVTQHGKAKATDFGRVTQDKAAGIMRTATNKVAYCNRWNQHQKCNRGVKFGPQKGMCAYEHACRWCKDGTAEHRGEQKDANGKWVCPNHP